MGELELPGPLVRQFWDFGGLGGWSTSPRLCVVPGCSNEQSPGVGGWTRSTRQGDGGDPTGFECHNGSCQIGTANALCHLERHSQLGPGAGAAAKRRQGALQLEERCRHERQAFDLAWLARGSSRVGRACWIRISLTFYRTQVYLGSDLWVPSVSNSLSEGGF